MNVPVIDGSRIVIVAGVANKPQDYTENEVRELTLLMQGLWQVLKVRRAEEELRAANEQLMASGEELRGQYEELAAGEQRVRESEEKYRTVVETAEEGIWIIDREFRTLFTNRKMQEIFGYLPEEMGGRPVWDFVPPEDAGSMKQELSGRPRGVPGRYERKWVRKDGTVIWCLTAATPLFSSDGTFAGSFGMFTDITARKEMENALRESEVKYRTVVEQSTDAIFIAQNGRLVFSNPALAAMTGSVRSGTGAPVHRRPGRPGRTGTWS